METPANSAPPEDLAPYTLTDASEILAVLRAIDERNTPLQIRIHADQAPVPSSLLEMDAGAASLVLDNPAGRAFGRQAESAESVRVHASLDRVHIQFDATPVLPCVHQDREALRAPLPSRLIRVQRRDYFRVGIPVSHPVLCHVPLARGTAELPLVDISAGGVALYDDAGQLQHVRGTIYQNCAITLSGIGTVTVTLRIAYVQQQTLPNGKRRCRVGCAYVDPRGLTLNTIQRYVTKLEREALARERGFD